MVAYNNSILNTNTFQVNKMIGFYKRYKQRKEENLAQIIQDRKNYIDILESDILIDKKEMLNGKCAPNSMENCNDKCMHFCDGYVKTIFLLDFGSRVVSKKPRCKLWGIDNH